LKRNGREFPRILAVSDIHSPVYLRLFREALQKVQGRDWCMLILAGDLIDRGRAEMLSPVVKFIDDFLNNIRLVAVFGNEEYDEVRDLLRRNYPRVIWLDDEYKVFDCEDASIAVVGTQGALDRLTSWQRRHRPFLRRVYDERPLKVRELVLKAKKEAEYVVLVSHYALSRKNLVGEDPRTWPELYSSKMERVVAETKPDVAVHGHAHNGSRFSMVGGVPVYNVALPLNKRIVELKLRTGLEAFF
jgi:Icc-related predicted phosphoesterase